MTRAALLVAALSALAGAAPAQIIESKFELFVTKPEESVRFYETLGFSVAHAKPDGYTTLVNGGTVVAVAPVPWWLPLRLAAWLRHPPLGTELVFYCASDRLAALRDAFVAAGYEPGEIARQPWGNLDFRITDPDGYYVRVSEGRAIPAPEAAE